MAIYGRKLAISLPWAILLFSSVLLAIVVYFSLSMTDKTLTETEGPLWLFAVGLVPGLTVALMQFLLSWAEFSKISKLSALNIKGVLNSRDEESFYSDLLGKAQKTIEVQGVTASRFATDFADESSSRADKKVLIAALARGVKVRILLPEAAYLTLEDREAKYPVAARIFGSLKARFPTLLEVKYFDHLPTSSIVRVDEDILVGPIFQNKASRHSPAIHTTTGSVLALSYLNNFDHEWSTARAL